MKKIKKEKRKKVNKGLNYKQKRFSNSKNYKLSPEKSSFLEHLDELRSIIIRILILLIIFTAVFYFISEYILNFVNNFVAFISLNLFDFFIAKLTISFYLSILILFPYLMKLIFDFIQPAAQESDFIQNLVNHKISFCFFFYLSFVLNLIVFYYFVHIIKFPVGIREFFSFFIKMHFFLLFGLFIILILNVPRRLFYVLSFICGALFTPPDVFSQIIFASLLIIIFELLNFFKLVKRKIYSKKPKVG